MSAARLVRYLVVIPLFAFVAVFQWRASRDTVHVERMLDLYVPFTLQPFSGRINSRAYTRSWEEGHFDPEHHSALRWGDELLSVNGREFRGMSVYLGELWNRSHRPSIGGAIYNQFTVTVRSADAHIRRILVEFPHCTCGVPTMFQAAAIWIVPPAFCVLLGFAIVTLRPCAMGSWAFLLAMLSLSQLQLWSEWYAGFQNTITPMQWTDWLRVPGVGYQAFVRCARCACDFLGTRFWSAPCSPPRRADGCCSVPGLRSAPGYAPDCLVRELPRIRFFVSAVGVATQRIDRCRAGCSRWSVLVAEPQLRADRGGDGVFRRGRALLEPLADYARQLVQLLGWLLSFRCDHSGISRYAGFDHSCF